MDNIAQAIEFAKLQASVRPMNSNEIVGMIKEISNGISSLEKDEHTNQDHHLNPPLIDVKEEANSKVVENLEILRRNPLSAIQQDKVICLECGEEFKILTKRHLRKAHNLTPQQYKALYGYKKDKALACGILVQSRKHQILANKIWEYKINAQHTPSETEGQDQNQNSLSPTVIRRPRFSLNIPEAILSDDTGE